MSRPRQTVGRPAFAGDAAQMLHALGPTVLPYGNGRSYGDSCLNGGGALVDARGLDRLLEFDPETGVLDVEAGVSLATILQYLTRRAEPERTWFVPVSPGTKFITVGGAIANDGPE